jgi:GPH family glycoside/pentoside/hexuronide:cation symporter
MQENKLKLSTKLGFGVGDIGGNVMFTIMEFWIQPFFYETLGLMPILAGTAVWIAKIWDAVTDPVMGFISDNTRTRWGRRRPYLFIGGIFAFFAMLIMFYNPHFNRATQQTEIFFWAVFAYCLLCTAYTIYNVPYSAITPDLTDSFHEQTSLNGWRMTFAVVGTLLGAGIFLKLVEAFTPAGSTDKSIGYLVTGGIFGALIMIVTLVTFFAVREKRVDGLPRVPFAKIFKSYLRVLKNKPYRIILLTYAINMIGTTVIGSNMQLYFKYIFHREDMTWLALLCLLGATMLCIKLWEPVIKRIGKNRSYAIGLFLIAAVTVAVFFLGPSLGMVFMFVMMGVAGIGLAATYIAPYAMIPDTIEYDQVKSGLREEGAYYGLWTFFSKSGQAMAGLVSGLILQIMNYLPPQTVVTAGGTALQDVIQSAEALLGIRLLLGPVATVFLILSGILVLTYPINEKVYKEIMAQRKNT